MREKIMLLAVLAVLALIAVPVSAQHTVFKSTLAPSFSFVMTGDGGEQQFPLIVGDNAKLTPNQLTVTTNAPYTLSITENSLLAGGTKPVGTAGRLTGIDFPSGAWNASVFVTTPLQVSVNGGTTYVSVPTTFLTEAVLRDAPAETFVANLTVKQTVLFSDKVTKTSMPVYSMSVLVIGANKP